MAWHGILCAELHNEATKFLQATCTTTENMFLVEKEQRNTSYGSQRLYNVIICWNVKEITGYSSSLRWEIPLIQCTWCVSTDLWECRLLSIPYLEVINLCFNILDCFIRIYHSVLVLLLLQICVMICMSHVIYQLV